MMAESHGAKDLFERTKGAFNVSQLLLILDNLKFSDYRTPLFILLYFVLDLQQLTNKSISQLFKTIFQTYIGRQNYTVIQNIHKIENIDVTKADCGQRLSTSLTDFIKSTAQSDSKALREYGSILLHRLTDLYHQNAAQSPSTISIRSSCRILVDSILSRPAHLESLLNNPNTKHLEYFFEDMMRVFLDDYNLSEESGLRHFMEKIKFVEKNMTEASSFVYKHLVESTVGRILQTQNNQLLHAITAGPYITSK